jgi:hypothetical protein
MNFLRFWIESTVHMLAICCVLLVLFIQPKSMTKAAARAIQRWRHLVASCEALNFLYPSMCTALHWRIAMAIKMASN